MIRFRLPANTRLPAELERAASRADATVIIRTNDPTRTLYDLTSWAIANATTLEGLDVTRPSLEDVYLELTGAEAGSE